MARLAIRKDLAPATSDEKLRAMYYNPATDEGYVRYPFFAERADLLTSLYGPPAGKYVCIAGAGYGYLVLEMILRGWSGCWAFDAALATTHTDATWFTGAKTTAMSASSVRLGNANALDLNGMRTWRRNTTPLTKNGDRWDVIVSEELLTCLSDSEVTTALSNLRADTKGGTLNGNSRVCHLVVCYESEQDLWLQDLQQWTFMRPGDLHPDQPALNWKTAAQWKALVGSDLLVSAADLRVVT